MNLFRATTIAGFTSCGLDRKVQTMEFAEHTSIAERILGLCNKSIVTIHVELPALQHTPGGVVQFQAID